MSQTTATAAMPPRTLTVAGRKMLRAILMLGGIAIVLVASFAYWLHGGGGGGL
jgi:hypothetical protein